MANNLLGNYIPQLQATPAVITPGFDADNDGFVSLTEIIAQVEQLKTEGVPVSDGGNF